MLKILNLEPEIFETHWIGDPAVDVAATDINTYVDTGEGCVSLPHESPSVIKYRALTPRELRNVVSDSAGQYLSQKPGEFVRYGLRSISGINLKFDKHGGVRGLNDDTLDAISEMTFDLPTHRVYQNFFAAMGYTVTLPESIGPVSLLDWLGGLIASKTFRK